MLLKEKQNIITYQIIFYIFLLFNTLMSGCSVNLPFRHVHGLKLDAYDCYALLQLIYNILN